MARWMQPDPPNLEYAADRLVPCGIVHLESASIGWECRLACSVKRANFSTFRHTQTEAFDQVARWLQLVECPGNVTSRPTAQLGRRS